MAFVGILSQIKLIFEPPVIQLRRCMMHVQMTVRVHKQTLKISRFEDQKVHVIATLFITGVYLFNQKIRSRLLW